MNPNKLTPMRLTDFIPVSAFTGLLGVSAPTINVTGSVAGTVFIGMTSDANDTALTKTEATNRTGITGVQAPSIESVGAGNPVLTEIGTLGLAGLKMNTANDDVRHVMRVPDYWDTRHDILVRAIWTNDSTDAVNDTVTWKMLYALLEEGTVLAAPAVALDTIIAADAILGTTAKKLHISPDGKILRDKITKTTTHLAFLMEMQAKANITEDIWLLGVEFEYSLRQGRGLQRAGKAHMRGQF